MRARERDLHLALVQLPGFVVRRVAARSRRDALVTMSAQRADEAGARGLDGRDLGAAERGVRLKLMEGRVSAPAKKTFSIRGEAGREIAALAQITSSFANPV